MTSWTLKRESSPGDDPLVLVVADDRGDGVAVFATAQVSDARRARRGEATKALASGCADLDVDLIRVRGERTRVPDSSLLLQTTTR